MTIDDSKLIAGKYRLVRLIARGGMGAVWEGIHVELGRRVAIKFIDPQHAERPELRRRFLNEARAAARLRSRHVVHVYDQGVADDERAYIVMEFLRGETLEERLRVRGRLSPPELAVILSQVCRGLAKAHAARVVHRDLKPANIYLTRDDDDDREVVKVVDFGIAKIVQTDAEGQSTTRTGAVLGTPQYMSPEQARGLRSVDYRADLWSVGVVAYRALTGALPFEGEAVGDLLVNICTQEPASATRYLAEPPPGLDAWFRRALARDPGARFDSAFAMATSFREMVGLTGDADLGVITAADEDTSSVPPMNDVELERVLGAGRPWSLRSRAVLVAAAACGVGLLFGFAVFGGMGQSAIPEPPTQTVHAINPAPAQGNREPSTDAPATLTVESNTADSVPAVVESTEVAGAPAEASAKPGTPAAPGDKRHPFAAPTVPFMGGTRRAPAKAPETQPSARGAGAVRSNSRKAARPIDDELGY